MEFITEIILGIVSALFAVILWWERKWKKDMETEINDIKKNGLSGLANVTDRLEDAVNNLNTVVQVLKSEVLMRTSELERRINGKQKWLEEHDKELKDHEKRITKIESQKAS